MHLYRLFGFIFVFFSTYLATMAQNWKLVWADEFTTGISPDWVFETGGNGWGNNELQYYKRENATVQNGQLVITAKRETVSGSNYTSARMKTQGKKSWKYGKIEARMAMPSFKGIWPAFWMLGDKITSVGWPACGEIDIMEHVNTGGNVFGTIHWDNNGYVHYGGSTTTSITQFHTYTIEWDALLIKWFVDGVKFHEVSIANGINGTSEFHDNFFILLNLAVGGNWPGFDIDNSQFPASLYVDYVRVYQNDTGNPPPPPSAGLIQAENYSSMYGVQKEPTTDDGGGLNVAFLDNGDWMAYAGINFPAPGKYQIDYRIASPNGGKLSADLDGNTVMLGGLDVPVTGDWQRWQTISQVVHVPVSGIHSLGVYVQQGGWNLNWLKVTQLTDTPPPPPPPASGTVQVGSGSYSATVPASENVNTDSKPLYVLPGVTDPIPTNDWWTPLILQNMYGSTKYHLWAHPLDFTVESYGLAMYFPTEWSGGTDMNKQMVTPPPVRIGGAGFSPSSEKVKSWGDWTVAFRLAESAAEYVDVTIGHGLPFTWLEYTGITTAQLTTDGSTSYFTNNGSAQAFPFTGDHVGFTWQGRNYAVFAPSGTRFSLANGVLSAEFQGNARYLVVAAMPAKANLSTFYQYAYAIPRNSTVGWQYNETAGKMVTTWTVTTQALQGSNTDVLQGFLPHQYKNTTLNFSPNGMKYLSARGEVRCATGNNFQVSYDFTGVLSHLPAPEVIPGKPNPYDASQMNTYINQFLGTQPLLGESNTYGSGKSLTQFARFIADATVLNRPETEPLKAKLKTALSNWFTYTTGETHTYYAYLNNFKALMGFDTGYGSEQFNDHHFHYGYHVYAAGVLGLQDASFISQYGEMAKLVAKEYANWDRTDKRFPMFRTFDVWEGHSWANGGYGMNPPIGNNEESSSEAMMSWTGIIQLGLALNDADMTAAGVFGYVTEAAATNEYWFDRDNENLPDSYGPPGKIACIVGGCNIEYQTFFGLNPIYVHAIQYIPVMPSSYYLVQNNKFTQAQTEFDFLRSRSVAKGFGDIGSWGDEWNNLALEYASLFNPEWSVANQNVRGVNAGYAGLSYYTIHSNRSLGKRRFDYHLAATNSGVFYNEGLNQFTYCAFNPSSTAKTYTVYQNTTPVGTITVPARSFYSTHTLDGGSVNQPPTVQLTVPATGATFNAPATILLTAAATDADGMISKVEFYQGANLLGTSTVRPYTFTWNAVVAGSYTLTAKATDNKGTSATSTLVSIVVNGSTPVPLNLATNKPVTVSSTETGAYLASNAVDGNLNTRWASGFTDPQWLYVDLGARYAINRVKLSWEAAFGKDYQIQVSDNAIQWTTIQTITGNTSLINNLTGISGTGRYVRIYGTARGTMYGYSLYELEVYGTPTSSGVCSGTAPNGDYRYEVSSATDNVNWTFVPLAPIAGSNLSILYIKKGTGNYVGYTMTASGNSFVFSQQIPAGTALSFYFTYRVGNTPVERNSSATPHSYIVGTTCASSRKIEVDDRVSLYPNPVTQILALDLPTEWTGAKVSVLDATGCIKAHSVWTDSHLTVSSLAPGIYTLVIQKDGQQIRRRFVKL